MFTKDHFRGFVENGFLDKQVEKPVRSVNNDN